MTASSGVLMDDPGRAPASAEQSYKDLIERLYALSRNGMKLGLDRVARVLDGLGNPETAFPTVHIAGSNGKGSTAAFLASIASAGGREVGLFTSPHLVSLTERVCFVTDHLPHQISQSAFTAAIEQVERVAPDFGDLTFFEIITAAGLVAMANRDVDLGVIEAGLGARLDATRLVDASVSVLTDLSIEHSAILGDTLEAIAQEKVAVLRPGRPLIAAGGSESVLKVIDGSVACTGGRLALVGRDIQVREGRHGRYTLALTDRVLEDVRPSLLGAHQARNALLAAEAAVTLDPQTPDAVIRAGLEATVWPGRMQTVERRGRPPVLLDGAHNPDAARALATALASPVFADRPNHLIFGVMSDKAVDQMLSALNGVARSFTLTRTASARAQDPRVLRHGLPATLRAEAAVTDSVPEALDVATARAQRDGGRVVVCGSLYLIGEAGAQLAGDFEQVLS